MRHCYASCFIDFDGEQVALRYKDYRDGDRQKVMMLSGEELLRHFLLHVLPKGLMRVRHYGFLANRCRAKRLPQIRAAIAAPPPADAAEASEAVPFDGYPCPICRTGRLRVRARLIAPRRDLGGGEVLLH